MLKEHIGCIYLLFIERDLVYTVSWIEICEYYPQTIRIKVEAYTALWIEMYEYLSNPEVVKCEPYRPMSMDEVRHNLEWRISTDEMTAVELKESHKMIGNVYLGKRDFESLEIGYVFNQDYWGKGYAKESCLALAGQAFSQGVHRIFAECDVF